MLWVILAIVVIFGFRFIGHILAALFACLVVMPSAYLLRFIVWLNQ